MLNWQQLSGSIIIYKQIKETIKKGKSLTYPIGTSPFLVLVKNAMNIICMHQHKENTERQLGQK